MLSFMGEYISEGGGRLVYSSRLLYYSGGLIDKFWIKFENGNFKK